MNEYQKSLIMLVEECSEVQHICSKIFRFGFNTRYNDISNKEYLEKELGDVLAMVDILINAGVINENKVLDNRNIKLRQLKVGKYFPDNWVE